MALDRTLKRGLIGAGTVAVVTAAIAIVVTAPWIRLSMGWVSFLAGIAAMMFAYGLAGDWTYKALPWQWSDSLKRPIAIVVAWLAAVAILIPLVWFARLYLGGTDCVVLTARCWDNM
jgi:putative flippase GtrA